MYNPYLILRILEEPCKFLPSRDLSNLQAFVVGHDTLLGRVGAGEAAYAWIPRELNSQAELKYRIACSENACGIYALVSRSDSDAFDLFAKEFRFLVQEKNWAGAPPDFADLGKRHVPSFLDANDLVEHLYRRHVFYIRRRSVILLRSFIDGFDWAASSVSTGHNRNSLSGFQEWLAEEFEYPQVFRWERVLLFECGMDETQAFDMFFKRIQQYRDARI